MYNCFFSTYFNYFFIFIIFTYFYLDMYLSDSFNESNWTFSLFMSHNLLCLYMLILGVMPWMFLWFNISLHIFFLLILGNYCLLLYCYLFYGKIFKNLPLTQSIACLLCKNQLAKLFPRCYKFYVNKYPFWILYLLSLICIPYSFNILFCNINADVTMMCYFGCLFMILLYLISLFIGNSCIYIYIRHKFLTFIQYNYSFCKYCLFIVFYILLCIYFCAFDLTVLCIFLYGFLGTFLPISVCYITEYTFIDFVILSIKCFKYFIQFWLWVWTEFIFIFFFFIFIFIFISILMFIFIIY
jgi:hypothetical protein